MTSDPMSTPASDVTARLDALLKPWDTADQPGLVIGVARDGETIYRRGLGLASIEHGRPNTPETRHRIGSTTKQFNCVGILLLAEDGKLDLDAPVKTYLPELPAIVGKPTLRQLMQHTGGVRDPMAAWFFMCHGTYGHIPAGGHLQLMQRFDGQNFEPGTSMAYSNTGYHLLTLVIERVSGQRWEEFMGARVFGPAGMKDTALLRSDMEIVPNVATLHVPMPGGSWRRGIYPSDELLGSGGMISTVDDMLRWAAQLRGPKRGVMREASWTRMFAHTRYPNGEESNMGLGIAREDWRGFEILHHAGAVIGAQSQLITMPAKGLDVAIMTNRMDIPAPMLAIRVIEAVLGDELPPPVVPPAAADYPALQGHWFSPATRTLVSIRAQKAKPEWPELMMMAIWNSPAGVLLRCGHGLSLPPGPMRTVEIRSIPKEPRPESLDIHFVGEKDTFQRLPEPAPEPAVIAADITGHYRYAEFGATLAIALRDGKLLIDFEPAVGFATWALEPFSADVLGCGLLSSNPPALVPMTGAISFERDSTGKVRGFWMNMDRVRGLWFERCE